MKIATTVARGLVTFLRSPLGHAAVELGLTQLTGPLAPIAARWGLNGLASFLGTWTAADFTEADVDAHMGKMVTVPVVDPSAVFA